MGNDGDKDLGLFGSECEDEGSELVRGAEFVGGTDLVAGASVDVKPALAVEEVEPRFGVLKLLSDETGTRLKKTLGMFIPELEKCDENVYFQFSIFFNGRDFSDIYPNSLNFSIKENYVFLVLNFLESKNRNIVSPGVLSNPEFRSVLTEQILKSFSFFTERELDSSGKNKAAAGYLTRAIAWINRSYQVFAKKAEADSSDDVQEGSIEKPEEV